MAFDFTFLDDRYNALYASEQRVSKLAQYFAFVAIVLSCLGLFGLAAFSAARRSKEISIPESSWLQRLAHHANAYDGICFDGDNFIAGGAAIIMVCWRNLAE